MANYMILIAIVILLIGIFAGSIESNLMEAFKDPEWMDISEWEDKL